MKKTSLLIIVMLLTAGMTKAQDVTIDFIPYHRPDYGIFNVNNVIQQKDGDIVSNVLVATPIGNDAIIEGNICYKVSPTELQYTDSVFVADSLPPWFLFAKNPLGEGNLRVNIEPDGNGGTAVRICHFPDDDLQIDHEQDVVAPLYDSIAFDMIDSYMIDSQNDLILKYYTEKPDGSYVCHISRVGLDGTVKHSATLPENQNFLFTMEEFESHPKQYFQWGINENWNLILYVIDSLFHTENSYGIYRVLEETWYNNHTYVSEEFNFGDSNRNSTFVVPDGDDLLVVAPYQRDSLLTSLHRETGVAVARYELRTMQLKALAHFNDWPGSSTYAYCMCFQKAPDGSLYMVYRELTPQITPTMTVAKLDPDLNLIWKRYCYEPLSFKYDPYSNMYSDMLKDENGNMKGIYIVGYASYLMQAGAGIFHFFLTDDGLTTVQEGNVDIRPYAYYPNPAQDQLHLQYSPDVQPKQVELYDLQGRLVRAQQSDLERINMQGLLAGQYLMKVTLKDGKVYSDKVVKE